METTERHLKTALKIIHEFHYNKQKVVFLGNFNLQKTYSLKSLFISENCGMCLIELKKSPKPVGSCAISAKSCLNTK